MAKEATEESGQGILDDMGEQSEQDLPEREISKAVANDQIQKLLEYYRIKLENIELEDGPAAVQTLVNDLNDACADKLLEVQDHPNGRGIQVVQNLQYPVGKVEKLVFGGKIATAKIAMDTAGKNKMHTKMFVFMASLSRVQVATLMELEGGDITIFDRLTQIFSMV